MTVALTEHHSAGRMSERDWLAAASPYPLIDILRTQGRFVSPATRRKLRLYCCAIVRSVWGRISDGRITLAIQTAELASAGKATDDEATEAHASARDAFQGSRLVTFEGAAAGLAMQGCLPRLSANEEEFRFAAMLGDQLGIARTEQAAMLRCLWPNPYRAATGDVCLRLRSSAGVEAIALARAAVRGRRLDDLAQLGGALDAAGLGDCELTRHLRGHHRCAACLGGGRADNGTELPCPQCAGGCWLNLPTLHVGGCWALDELLGY